ncbi:hypothetical protein HYPSUDRAFT_368212 [Hypholoma sublateritium FD-334 SS-4]|uniref:Uncharacterized protein n=1 Tax=Hypholoma sublateritium (strain FD-334 SS-4) TaxID=945553 RepID=A0A0D2P4P3_HYPSF|nr:hypothetical protein HYPSUDRAFT_368212 [Hypholoma sublateritium FD-334 SS-4]
MALYPTPALQDNILILLTVSLFLALLTYDVISYVGGASFPSVCLFTETDPVHTSKIPHLD